MPIQTVKCFSHESCSIVFEKKWMVIFLSGAGAPEMAFFFSFSFLIFKDFPTSYIFAFTAWLCIETTYGWNWKLLFPKMEQLWGSVSGLITLIFRDMRFLGSQMPSTWPQHPHLKKYKQIIQSWWQWLINTPHIPFMVINWKSMLQCKERKKVEYLWQSRVKCCNQSYKKGRM